MNMISQTVERDPQGVEIFSKGKSLCSHELCTLLHFRSLVLFYFVCTHIFCMSVGQKERKCVSVSQNISRIFVQVQKYFIAYSKGRNSYKAAKVPTDTVRHGGSLNLCFNLGS